MGISASERGNRVLRVAVALAMVAAVRAAEADNIVGEAVHKHAEKATVDAQALSPAGECEPPNPGAVSTWIGGNGNWFDISHWSAGVPDAIGEAALIDASAASADISVDDPLTLDSIEVTEESVELYFHDADVVLDDCWGLRTDGELVFQTGVSSITGNLLINSNGGGRVLSGRTFEYRGPLWINEGLFNVGQNINSTATLRISGSSTLAGEGEIAMLDTAAALNVVSGTLTVGSGQTIAGRGVVDGDIVNEGVIAANRNGGTLRITSDNLDNNGSLAALDGTLRVEGTVVENSGGLIEVVGDALVLDVALVRDGELSGLEPAFIESRNTTLEDVLNSGQLLVASNTQTTVTGSSLTNDGVIWIGPNSNVLATLVFDGAVDLQGAGAMLMPAVAATISTTPGSSISIAGDQLIHGRGTINAKLSNAGTIQADYGSGSTLLMTGEDKSNSGTLRAANNAILELESFTLDNTGGGIEADNSEVRLSGGVEVVAGQLQSAGDGLIRCYSATLENVTNHGAFLIDPSDSVTLRGFLVNDGMLYSGSGANAATRLFVEGPVAISGAGHVQLLDTQSQINAESNGFLSVGGDQLVHGRGRIAAPLQNFGTIRADYGGNQTLQLEAADKINDGLMQAMAGSVLGIDGIVLANTNGVIEADAGTVRLENGARVSQGYLQATSNGIVLVQSGAIDDITHDGLLRVLPSGTLVLDGEKLLNLGSIELGAGVNAATTMLVDSGVELAGDGDIHMLDTVANLSATSNGLLYNRPAHVIHGRGRISTPLVNYGTIIADYSFGQHLDLQTSAMANIGEMMTTNGAILAIKGIRINNNSGVIAANHGNVELENGTISFGTLTSGGASVIHSAGGRLEDLENQGRIYVQPNTTTRVGGTVVNNGTVDLGSGVNAASRLLADGAASLEGLGQVRMLDSVATLGAMEGSVLTIGTGQVVEGRGRFEGSVINWGLIDATHSSGMTVTATSNGFTNEGTLRANVGNISIFNAEYFETSGRVEVAAGRVLTANGGYQQDGGTTSVAGSLRSLGGDCELKEGKLAGGGTIEGVVVSNGGATAPGAADGADVGTLHISGAYTQGSGASLLAQIGGLAAGVEHDQLTVSGSAALGGELRMSVVNDFIPEVGDEVVVLTAASVSGEFATISGSGTWVADYNATNVTLGLTQRPGDIDNDGDLDLDDHAGLVDCMSGPGQAPAPSASGVTTAECLSSFDFDVDGDVDLEDFGVFARVIGS